MKPKKIILAGGSGLLGQRLRYYFLDQGHEVITLTRQALENDHPRHRYVGWDGTTAGPWQQELETADVLINLTGKSVQCRFTEANQRAILDSRLAPTRILGQTLRQLTHPPRIWVQAAGISIYGDTGTTVCDETSETHQMEGRRWPHDHFLPEVCERWENAFQHEAFPNGRKILLRISSVLATEAGALKLLAPMTRWGLGGTVLPGTQYMSWIHVDDLVRATDWLVEHPTAQGAYNLTAPQPVTNQKFMSVLRQVLKRRQILPVPEFALKLGCLTLQTEPVLAQVSIRTIPKRLQEEGFHFHYPELQAALRHLYPQKGTQP